MSAPACGLAEHYEARRKEVAFLRQAYNQLQKQKESLATQSEQSSSSEQTSTSARRPRRPCDYEEVGYCYDGLTEDQARRLKHYETMVNSPRTNDSAKLPRRFNNIDYKSQW